MHAGHRLERCVWGCTLERVGAIWLSCVKRRVIAKCLQKLSKRLVVHRIIRIYIQDDVKKKMIRYKI